MLFTNRSPAFENTEAVPATAALPPTWPSVATDFKAVSLAAHPALVARVPVALRVFAGVAHAPKAPVAAPTAALMPTVVPKAEYKVVIPNFGIERAFATHVLYDSINDQYRLYLFFTGLWKNTPPTDTRGAIAFSHVPLLKDGAVATAQNGVITCPALKVINLPSRTVGQGPRVVEWDGNILVLVSGSTEFHVRMGKIGKDASLPEPNDWKTISSTFQTPIETVESCFGGAAVVPPKFVND